MGPLLCEENITFYLETHAIIGFYCVRNCVIFYYFFVQTQKGELDIKVKGVYFDSVDLFALIK